MKKISVVQLGAVEDVPLGQGRCFIVETQEVAIFRQRDGALFAIENTCPHRRGPLADGVMGDGKVVCPLHGHKFDLITGKGSEGSECVKTFKVWEEQGNVFLEYSQE